MHVMRHADAPAYPARNHHGMAAVRLQGQEATPAAGWVGLSLFLPGGGAERSASPGEKIYVLLEGEITVVFDDKEVTLGPLDSILIESGEDRSVENRGKHLAKMLVISNS